MEQTKRRIICFSVVITVLLSALAVRVYSIQIVQGPVYEAMARSQQRIALSGVDSRGEICDRNGEPLTGARLEYVYILKRDQLQPAGEQLLERVGARERQTSNQKYRIFTSVKYQKDVGELLRMKHGAYILRIPQRYTQDQPASYLLGYVRSSDNVGMTGLEAAYDEYLSQRDKVIYGVADAKNRIITGYGVQNTEEREVKLVTTLDKNLQVQVEKIVDRVDEGRTCAIITEVKTGDILTCATSPGFDPMMADDLLQKENQELVDIALQGMYPPGPMFQVIVTAAALEAGIDSPEKILDMAQRFGFGREVLNDLNMENPGNLPIEEGALLVTPLQIAQMTQVIAAGGMDTGLWLTYLQERHELQRIISEATAMAIMEMMRKNVVGEMETTLGDWNCGGMAGLSEGFLDGEPVVHGWFTGVVPSEDPQFTVTVFVEGGGVENNAAVPVFKKILEVLELEE